MEASTSIQVVDCDQSVDWWLMDLVVNSDNKFVRDAIKARILHYWDFIFDVLPDDHLILGYYGGMNPHPEDETFSIDRWEEFE